MRKWPVNIGQFEYVIITRMDKLLFVHFPDAVFLDCVVDHFVRNGFCGFMERVLIKLR